MADIRGTSGNDVIVATADRGHSWGDKVYGEGGDDTVTLGPGVTFVSGPGNDSVTGVGGGAYAFWSAPGPVTVNLAQGWAQDGYGGTDRVSGITEVHLPSAGGMVTGTSAAEMVFCFGGNTTIDLGTGADRVQMHQLPSTNYSIRQFSDRVVLKGSDHTVELRNVESVEFADRTIELSTRGSAPYFSFRYDVHSFVETQWSSGWWYAGVYSPPQLVSYFPQAVAPFDLGTDGDQDLVLPISRGYRTGVDTRHHFQVLENVNGTLRHSAEMTAETPFIAGSRRSEPVYLARYDSHALVSIAHDTAIETETRFDIPWRLGDVAFILANPFDDVTSALVPTATLPHSAATGRSTAVDAHSLGVGDVNGDGMEDVVVGDFSGPFLLLQTASGMFTYSTSSLLRSLGTTWKEPTLPNASTGVLTDLHLADLNGDRLEDLVTGWGHNTGLSRVFFNDGHGAFTAENSTTLPVSLYGVSNSLHMKTMSGDFDRDGDIDLVLLNSRYEPYYGGNYLQFLLNDGGGRFSDATVARLGDPATLRDTYGARLEWTDYWQVLDVNRDGALDIAGHTVIGGTPTPFVYMNDGTGHFTRLELPGQAGTPISWGDFDRDGNIDVLTFSSRWTDAQGTSSVNTFSVYEMKTPNPGHALAFDLAGHAGTVAKILGAVFGKAAVANAAYAGIGLSLADSGMPADALFSLALDAALGTSRSDATVVDLLYTNVVGQPPGAARAPFVSLLESGQATQVSLGWMAANHDMNLANIDYTGLARTGLEYLPVA